MQKTEPKLIFEISHFLKAYTWRVCKNEGPKKTRKSRKNFSKKREKQQKLAIFGQKTLIFTFDFYDFLEKRIFCKNSGKLRVFNLSLLIYAPEHPKSVKLRFQKNQYIFVFSDNTAFMACIH